MAKRKLTFEKFDTLNSLIHTMDGRPLNPAFAARPERASSNINESERKKKFSAVNNYSEAMDLVRSGYKDPLQKMKKAILNIGRNDEIERPRPFNDMVGYAPNVPAALMGLPKSMRNRKRVPQKENTIHFVYSFCAHGGITTDQLIKAGINVISLINSIEKQGSRVKIDILFLSSTNKSLTGYMVNVKKYGQTLNLLKLSFPLVHPAMLRRLSFKYLETAPNVKDQDYPGGGYGTPLFGLCSNDSNKERALLKEYGIITDDKSIYCNAYDAMDSKDIDQLARKIHLTDK